MNNDCIFCKIINKEFDANIIYEDDYIIAFLDKFPSSLGHTLIVPKKHVSNIFELDNDTGNKIFSKAIDISKKMKKVLNINDINILQNNGVLASQTVFHFHMHIIPRYENDDVNIKWKTTSPTDDDIKLFMAKMKTKEV